MSPSLDAAAAASFFFPAASPDHPHRDRDRDREVGITADDIDNLLRSAVQADAVAADAFRVDGREEVFFSCGAKAAWWAGGAGDTARGVYGKGRLITHRLFACASDMGPSRHRAASMSEPSSSANDPSLAPQNSRHRALAVVGSFKVRAY